MRIADVLEIVHPQTAAGVVRARPTVAGYTARTMRNAHLLFLPAVAVSLAACGSVAGGGPGDAGNTHVGSADGRVALPVGDASHSTPDAGGGGPTPDADRGVLDAAAIMAPADATVEAHVSSSDAGSGSPNLLDSALPDSSGSPIETFEIVQDGNASQPHSCPTSHWEFPFQPGSATLRNMAAVPLAYISEPMGWIGGVYYSPGVPTGESQEQVGVLAPGATVRLGVMQTDTDLVALVGASKPFSVYDGGFAAADEWTIPWPEGVSGGGGATTMHVADIEAESACSPVFSPDN